MYRLKGRFITYYRERLSFLRDRLFHYIRLKCIVKFNIFIKNKFFISNFLHLLNTTICIYIYQHFINSITLLFFFITYFLLFFNCYFSSSIFTNFLLSTNDFFLLINSFLSTNHIF